MTKPIMPVGSLTVLLEEHIKKKRKERDHLLAMVCAIPMERELEEVLETLINQAYSNYKEPQNEDR